MVRCALLLCELPRSVREIESTAIKYSTSVLLCQMGYGAIRVRGQENGILCELSSGLNIQLVHDVLAVALDSLQAQAESRAERDFKATKGTGAHPRCS